MLQAPRPIQPAPQQENNQHQAHRLAVAITTPNRPVGRPQFMSPRAPARRSIGGGDPLGIVHGLEKAGHWLAPHGFHPKQFFFGTKRNPGIQAVPGQLAQMFDPRTKAGIANIAGTFIGGGDMPGMERVGVTGELRDYSFAHAPNKMSLEREGPLPPGKGYNPAAERMIGSMKGVGGYKRANPLDVLEQRNIMQQKAAARADALKNVRNRLGGRVLQQNKANNVASEIMGGKFGTFGPDAISRDIRPADYADRNTLVNLSRNNPDNPILPQGRALNPTLRYIYDMLFGHRDAQWFGPKPPRP